MSWPSQFGEEDEKEQYDIHPSTKVPCLSFAFDYELLHVIYEETNLDLYGNLEACEEIILAMGFSDHPRIGITFVGYSSKEAGQKPTELGFSMPHFGVSLDTYPLDYELLVGIDLDFVRAHSKKTDQPAFTDATLAANEDSVRVLAELLAWATDPEASRPRVSNDIQAILKQHEAYQASLPEQTTNEIMHTIVTILDNDPWFAIYEPEAEQ